jgi:ABC-type Fe3+ transport system substrate-binding protein
VYQPPRSTDILLQEFIARGPNDGDAATVYESVALYRQKQSGTNQGAPYRVYYPDPTVETIATAAIVRRGVSDGQRRAAERFIDFLREGEQQRELVRFGFRPVVAGIDILSVNGNPWGQNIQGIEVVPRGASLAPPDSRILEEIQRSWERADRGG